MLYYKLTFVRAELLYRYRTLIYEIFSGLKFLLHRSMSIKTRQKSAYSINVWVLLRIREI